MQSLKMYFLPCRVSRNLRVESSDSEPKSKDVLTGPETIYQGDDALSTKPVIHYQGTAYLCY